MGWFFGSPCPDGGCCEGDPCIIKEDEFTRADGSIGGDWTAPDWDIDTNAAVTTTSDAPAIAATLAADSNGVVSVAYTGDDHDDELLLIISWEDSSNYLFALFKLSSAPGECGEMSLWKREGGTNTQLGYTRTIDDFEPDAPHNIGLCRDGTKLTAYREAGGVFTSLESDLAPGTIAGLQAGFASGTITARVTVDDFLWSPYSDACRECAAPCEFFLDDFNRSDSTDLGCNWTEEAGSSQILSNELSLSANSIAITTVETPTGTQLAMAHIDPAANNDAGRVILRYTDTSNYLFGEIVFGGLNSNLNIYQRSGGTNTLRGTLLLSGRTSANPLFLKVCYYGNTLTAQVFLSISGTPGALIGSVAGIVSSPPSGLRAGVATAAASSATAFDSFKLLRHNTAGRTECDECSAPCGSCDVAYQPFSAYAVDLGSPPLTDSACGYCDQIGGEYLIERSNCSSACAWLYCVPAVCDRTPTSCTAGKWTFNVALSIVSVSAGVMKWRLTVGYVPSVTCTCATDPACVGVFVGAVYESSNQSGSTRCQDVPVTLTKLTDTFSSSGECGGSLPSTVTLTRAA